MKVVNPIIALHGGAGSRAMSKAQRTCMVDALVVGYDLLRSGIPAVQAVEEAIRTLEGSGLFNAGQGSRVQLDGVRRMDASIMEGRALKAGAVAAIEGIRHPITAARLVMERTNHVLLAGKPATRFAHHYRVERLPRPMTRRSEGRRDRLNAGARKTLTLFRSLYPLRPTGLETVGAVARGQDGTVAAGASTGGIAYMLPGRVGDTPLIGSGVYADDEAGAVSMTGIGEAIIRLAVAKEIIEKLRIGISPAHAGKMVLQRLVRRTGGSAGALVLSSTGRLGIHHVTPRMAAGYWDGRSRPSIKDRFDGVLK